MPAGRPPIFDTPEALQKKVDEYFVWVKGSSDHEPEPITITGLVLFLGFVNRQSMYDYENRNDEFSGIVKTARSRVENDYEKALRTNSPTGPIFALKQMGWTDKQEFTGKDGKDLFDSTDVRQKLADKLTKLKDE